MTKLSEKPSEQSQLHSLQRDFWKLLPIFAVFFALWLSSKWISADFYDKSAAVIFTVLTFLLAHFTFVMKKSSEQPTEQSQLRSLLRHLLPIFAVLIALLLSKLISADFSEISKAVVLTALIYLLAYYTFGLYYHWFVKHPAEIQFDEAQKLLVQSRNYLDNANKLLVPSVLFARKAIIVGSTDDKDHEMMEELFKEYFDDPQTIDISFMGTAYGAFRSGEKNSFGFIDALIKHIENCDGKVNYPFADMNFVCCTENIYNLSAKYLSFSIFNQIIKYNLEFDTKKPLKVVYFHEDCITATLILKGHGRAGKIALISPSIGKFDKKFLSDNYPIGIVIKDIVSVLNASGSGEVKTTEPAEATFRRIEAQFAEILRREESAYRTERWVLTKSSLTINNIHKVNLALPESKLNEITSDATTKYRNQRPRDDTELTDTDIFDLSCRILNAIFATDNAADTQACITLLNKEVSFACEFILSFIEKIESKKCE